MEAAALIDLGWSSGDIEDTFPMARFEFVKIQPALSKEQKPLHR